MSLDFGFYLGAQAYGQAVLNGVINHADHSNKTTVTGGATVPATGIAQGIPALYAMSCTNATGGLSMVITNKSATAHQVTIRVNGENYFSFGYASIGEFLELVYNQKRLHSALGYLPPAEFEQNGGAAQ